MSATGLSDNPRFTAKHKARSASAVSSGTRSKRVAVVSERRRNHPLNRYRFGILSVHPSRRRNSFVNSYTAPSSGASAGHAVVRDRAAGQLAGGSEQRAVLSVHRARHDDDHRLTGDVEASAGRSDVHLADVVAAVPNARPLLGDPSQTPRPRGRLAGHPNAGRAPLRHVRPTTASPSRCSFRLRARPARGNGAGPARSTP